MALGRNFHQSCVTDGGKVGENPAALRAAVFSLASKNLRGAFKRPPPPIRAQVNAVKRFKATGTTADKAIPCRRKSVRVKKVVEAVKKRISRSSRPSRISPVLVPPPSRQVSGSSCMPRAEISEFVHVVVIGIHFHVRLEISKPICLTVF